ncbi:hypothetical protein C1645_878098 [Glomus cerebriforme]|uniref:Uncharacterized protein n=1 Tax=Glomus cerebriforme TaxID=658196 RepID=A0A397SRX3_9GLOM|nr:hypothetical protein C1645_878098 [Glomus cerebriforme]
MSRVIINHEEILDLEQTPTDIQRIKEQPELSRNLLRFETNFKKKLNDISDIIKEQKLTLNAIKELAHKLFHNHKTVSDKKMKKMLKEILENKESFSERLEELNKKGVLYDKLWNDTLYSEETDEKLEMNSTTKQVHNDLYNPINPDDKNSDTYLSSIIKKVFIASEEQTRKNAIWCQTILEIIFDEDFLSLKLETDIINKWYTKLLKILFFGNNEASEAE